MKTIKIYTGLVYGGWGPEQLETGIGGSEEKLIELARELAKENKVTVYMNGTHRMFDGVSYEDHRNFVPWEPCDLFISFKAAHIFTQSINAKKKVHLSTEVENWESWMFNNVDIVSCISDYHRHRMSPQSDKLKTMYLWADFERMEKNKVEKEPNTMLYCSSFDRGLEELLVNWPKVKEKLGVKKLYITYGWDFMVNLIKSNPHLASWKGRIEELCNQEGIEFVGRLSNDEMCKMYWKCEYWCLPLNNPDSELFCMNAIKAQFAGCIPVVRKIGALQETVNDCINWDWILDRPNQQNTWQEDSLEKNRKHAEKFSLESKVQEWKELIKNNT